MLFVLIGFLMFGNAFANQPAVYPAEKNGKWGLITKSGRFLISPEFASFIYTPELPVFAFADHGNELNATADLIIFDSTGTLLFRYKDSLLKSRSWEGYRPTGKYSSTTKYIAHLLNIELENPKTLGLIKNRTTYSYQKIELNPTYDWPDSTVKLGNGSKRAFFKVGAGKPIYSYACRLLGSLYLVNLGGYTQATYHESERNGCVHLSSYYEYENVSGGKWGVVDVNNKEVIPIEYNNKESIALFSAYSNRYTTAFQCVVAGTTLPKSLKRQNITVIDKNSQACFSGKEVGSTYTPIALSKFFLLKIENRSGLHFLVFNQALKPIDTFYNYSTASYGNEFIARNSSGWHYFNENGEVTKLISNTKSILQYHNDSFCKEQKNDTTWQIYNFYTNQENTVPSKYFRSLGSHHIYYHKNDSTFVLNLNNGTLNTFKGSFSPKRTEYIFCSSRSKYQGRPTFSKDKNTVADAFNDLLIFEGHSFYNDSFLIDRKGNRVLRNFKNEVASIGALVEVELKDRYYHNYSNSLYINDEYFRMSGSSLNGIKLTNRKNFATLSFYKSNWNRKDINKALLYFPKNDKFLIFDSKNRIKELRDFGGILAIRVFSEQDNADIWLFFNEKGRQLVKDANLPIAFKRAKPKTLKLQLTLAAVRVKGL